MKILVIGGSGLVGSHLLRAARAAGHEAVGTYRQFPVAGLRRFDAASDAVTAELLRDVSPDAVVYAAGWQWVDGCEDDPTRAFTENADQPGAVARLCHERGIHFTAFSTSYVFDGQRGPYSEADAPNPINVYARSKLRGEQNVLATTAGTALIPRVICVYGAEAQGKNFASQVWRALTQGQTLTLPSDQCGNPSYAPDIARCVVRLLERRERGVWHLAGPRPDCTRVEWAEQLVAAFQAAGVARHPDFAIKAFTTAELKQRAARPLLAGMVSQKHPDYRATEFGDSVREMVEQTD